MKEFWVEIIRRETSIERNIVCVEANSAEEAKARVYGHYMEGDGLLSDAEQNTEQHNKHLGVDETEVIDIGEAEEA